MPEVDQESSGFYECGLIPDLLLDTPVRCLVTIDMCRLFDIQKNRNTTD